MSSELGLITFQRACSRMQEMSLVESERDDVSIPWMNESQESGSKVRIVIENSSSVMLEPRALRCFQYCVRVLMCSSISAPSWHSAQNNFQQATTMPIAPFG